MERNTINSSILQICKSKYNKLILERYNIYTKIHTRKINGNNKYLSIKINQ